MGGVGSDIAVDAADIALVDDEVKELPHLVALSRRMMTTIKLNLTFSMTLNFIAIALAINGTLDPVVGALVHNAGSVLVITNSAFLLNWRKRSKASARSAGRGSQKDLHRRSRRRCMRGAAVCLKKFHPKRLRSPDAHRPGSQPAAVDHALAGRRHAVPKSPR